MSRQLTTTIVGFGVFVLLIGLVIAPTITASNTDASQGYELAEGENATVTEGLEITVDKVGPSNATITLKDTHTRLSETNELAEGDNSTYSVNGENMTVTLENIDDNSVTRTTVEYPRTYGWSDSTKLYANQFDVLLGIIAFLMVMGSLGAVTKI